MDVRPISKSVSVCDQLTPRDLTLVYALGFRSVICNRPDGEAEDQPLFATIAQAANLSGIDAHYIPVPPGGPEPEQIEKLKALWHALPKPVLAYCRGGARSAALFKAAQPA